MTFSSIEIRNKKNPILKSILVGYMAIVINVNPKVKYVSLKNIHTQEGSMLLSYMIRGKPLGPELWPYGKQSICLKITRNLLASL